MLDVCLSVCLSVGEYCVIERYDNSYAAFASYDTCYVAYNDSTTSLGILWFDAVNR